MSEGSRDLKLREELELTTKGAPRPRLDEGQETRPAHTEAAPLTPIGPGPTAE